MSNRTRTSIAAAARVLLLLPLLLLPSAAPAALSAQQTSPAGMLLVENVVERWIHAGEKPAGPLVLRLDESTEPGISSKIDSVIAVNGGRTFYLSLQRSISGSYTRSADGRIIDVRGQRNIPEQIGITRSAEDLEQSRRISLFESWTSERLGLPAARIWERAVSFHPTRVAIGERWVDTLAFTTRVDSFEQKLSGVRVSTIIGDSVVDGRRVWWVRDSALVDYSERFVSEDRVAGRLIPVVRTGRGVVRGRHLYDPAWGMYLVRDDSASLIGTVQHLYPDGRVLQTPARMERIRHQYLQDSTTRRLVVRNRPRWSSEQIIAAEAMPRLSIEQVLARGDTAAALDSLSRGSGARRTLDMVTVPLMVDVLSDPARALRYHVNLGYIYSNAFSALASQLPALQPDSAHWACTRAACRLLASQWQRASEPRLRELALAAHFALDPRTWVDTVRAWTHVDDAFERVINLANGVATGWPAGARARIPSPGEDWPAWLQWMDGRNPAYPQMNLGDRDTVPTARPNIRFGDTHTTALRVRTLIDGRDFVREFNQRLATATNDTAQRMYRTMLIGLGAYRGNPDSIVARMTTGSPADRASAVQEMVALFGTDGRDADDATATTIQDGFLSIVLDGAAPWRSLITADGSGESPSRIVPRTGDSVRIRGELTPAVQEIWARRFRIVPSAANTPNAPGVTPQPQLQVPYSAYSVSNVTVAGPFARLEFVYTYRTPGAEPAPSRGAYATGYEIYFLRMDGQWVIAAMPTWWVT